MAIMIPEKPRKFAQGSLEGEMFSALEKLPDGYFVFHSFRITEVANDILQESETDFVIFHAGKGVLCLEAKAGQISYDGGCWRYGNGKAMHNGGPFNQASANKWKLMYLVERSPLSMVLERFPFLHGVWFPSLDMKALGKIQMPPEGDIQLVMSKTALSDPLSEIERLFTVTVPGVPVTNISDKEASRLIKEIFCPEFNVFPSAGFDTELKKNVFHRMLREQSGILDYLTEQRSAAVNGAAGTGKTMIAVEKARRHAANNERVLFLCYNAALNKWLRDCFGIENVDFMTIDGYVCRLCKSRISDYGKAEKELGNMYSFNCFPYRHVIVDEGQDFGKKMLEETAILRMLWKNIMERADNSSFYVFYDRLQMIQAPKVPDFIGRMECHLTLHKNCRNTKNIAVTATEFMPEIGPMYTEGNIPGKLPRFRFRTSVVKQKREINIILEELEKDGEDDIIILTCRTEESSILAGEIFGGFYRQHYRFTTCRKFKGLEADVVILIDLDAEILVKQPALFYVGCTRARIRLDIVTGMDTSDCESILKEHMPKMGKPRNARRDLVRRLGGIEI